MVCLLEKENPELARSFEELKSEIKGAEKSLQEALGRRLESVKKHVKAAISCKMNEIKALVGSFILRGIEMRDRVEKMRRKRGCWRLKMRDKVSGKR
jgi:hypothetical protein